MNWITKENVSKRKKKNPKRKSKSERRRKEKNQQKQKERKRKRREKRGKYLLKLKKMTPKQRRMQLSTQEGEEKIETFFDHKIDDGCYECEMRGDCIEYEAEIRRIEAKYSYYSKNYKDIPNHILYSIDF
eukprot:UN00277